MGLYIQKNEQRSDLQEKIAADLRAKAKARQDMDDTPRDGIEDSAYLKGTKQTTSLAGVWLAIFAVIIVLIIVFIVLTNRG